ncbi:hypothetical protein [Nocardia caishijiensis]|uniref:YcxB-like protein n=1 Tax=Nocardia caishijiensis TaxID=184756 RepID=A0ABQ6YHA6_9NOCA|nr:hypothetical protein [Nocardia caishijiensis]KAF0845028.1 hypothetical protein FNL39_10956 [Nocardia caishijiensis]
MHPQQSYPPPGQPGYPQQQFGGQPPQFGGYTRQPGGAQPQQFGAPAQQFGASPPRQVPAPPQQQFGAPTSQPGSPQPGAPIDVTYVCDDNTAKRLNRAAALVSFRLPNKWGLLLALPAFMLARGTISVLSDGGEAVIGEMAGAFFIVVAFELVVIALAVGLQLARVNPKFKAIAGPGHQMRAQYTDDAVRLWQTTGEVTNRYVDFKRVLTQGDVVFLQPTGTQGFVVPRELVPDAALARLRRA